MEPSDLTKCCWNNNKPPIWKWFIHVYTTYENNVKLGDGLWHCFTNILSRALCCLKIQLSPPCQETGRHRLLVGHRARSHCAWLRNRLTFATWLFGDQFHMKSPQEKDPRLEIYEPWFPEEHWGLDAHPLLTSEMSRSALENTPKCHGFRSFWASPDPRLPSGQCCRCTWRDFRCFAMETQGGCIFFWHLQHLKWKEWMKWLNDRVAANRNEWINQWRNGQFWENLG